LLSCLAGWLVGQSFVWSMQGRAEGSVGLSVVQSVDGKGGGGCRSMDWSVGQLVSQTVSWTPQCCGLHLA
jgi:hypothetical protein